MAPIVYTSADASAPTIIPTTAITDITSVFKACLVDGYGAKSAAGWSKPFEDSTFTVLRPGAGSRPYLQMRKSSYSAVIYWETMSGVNTGTNGFTDNANFHEAIETGRGGDTTTPRPWVMVADSRTCYFWVDAGLDGGYGSFAFGDFYSYKPADAYNGMGVATISTRDTNPFKTYHWYAFANSTVNVIRSYTQTGLQVAGSIRGDTSAVSSNNLRGVLPYPNPAGSEIWLAPIYLHESGVSPARGKLRGLWHWLHPINSVADRDTFNGTGNLSGKTFMIIKQSYNFGLIDGLWVVETSDTWLTN